MINTLYNIAPCQERDVRLVGGDSYGRVELCSNEEWVSICSDQFWDDIDAGVLCRQLGFSRHGKILCTTIIYLAIHVIIIIIILCYTMHVLLKVTSYDCVGIPTHIRTLQVD